jgi:hypothetical protein
MKMCPSFQLQDSLQATNLCSVINTKWTGIEIEFKKPVPEFIVHFTSCEKAEKHYYGYSQLFKNTNSTFKIPFPAQTDKIATIDLKLLKAESVTSIQFICDPLKSVKYIEQLPPKESLPIHQFLALLGLLWTLI